MGGQSTIDVASGLQQVCSSSKRGAVCQSGAVRSQASCTRDEKSARKSATWTILPAFCCTKARAVLRSASRATVNRKYSTSLDAAGPTHEPCLRTSWFHKPQISPLAPSCSAGSDQRCSMLCNKLASNNEVSL